MDIDEPRGMTSFLGLLCLGAFVGLSWAAWELGDWLSERAWWGRLA